MKSAFLILNYLTYWETKNCVKSIILTCSEKRLGDDFTIVIVDNGSTNNSYEILQNEYKDVNGIYILSTGNNLGFAKGNNIGFSFIKRYLDSDFIIMINSDIVMNDNKFIDKLYTDYNRIHFAVAGPNVCLPDGTCLNPGITKKIDIINTDKEIKATKNTIKLCQLGIEPFVAGIRRIIKKITKTPETVHVFDNDNLNSAKGESLHGCFLIFSPLYISKFDGLYDKTFLYCEETLLTLRCNRAGLKVSYLEDLNAIHNESRTEKFIGGSINKRHLRRARNMLNSLMVVRNYLVSNDL